MIEGIVAELWRYTVKSMRGEALDSTVVTARGLTGDRAYALLDTVTGKIASAKQPRLWGGLLDCKAALVEPADAGAPAPRLHITLPDGRVVTDQNNANYALSAQFGRAVTLLDEPPVRPEIDRYWPDVDGLSLRDTMSSGPIGLGAPPGTFFDYAPLHLVTQATLARLQTLYRSGQIAVPRFRPNLVIALTETLDRFVENDWVGRTLAIGEEVRVRVTDPTPRCVVPTLPQTGGVERDIDILRAVAAHNRPPVPALGGQMLPSLGVYAVVECGGTICHGAVVRVI